MKRTRYTITYSPKTSNAVEKVVVLAYGPDDAVRVFHKLRGGTVLDCEKGDHRVKARNAAVKAAGGFRLNLAAIEEAKDLLGITWPVKITTNARVGSTLGRHIVNYEGSVVKGNRLYGLEYAKRGGQHHSIMLKAYLSPEEAGRTLWHELTHAMQAERFASRAGAVTPVEIHRAVLGAQERSGSYTRRPIEVEARDNEAFNDDLPLAR